MATVTTPNNKSAERIHESTMTGYIEAAIDNNAYDFLGEMHLAESELAGCTLAEEELERFLAPPQEKWTDLKNKPAFITMDDAKKTAWAHWACALVLPYGQALVAWRCARCLGVAV